MLDRDDFKDDREVTILYNDKTHTLSLQFHPEKAFETAAINADKDEEAIHISSTLA